MRVVAAVLLLIFATGAPAMDSAAKYAVWGVGGKACFTYTKERKAGNYQSFRDYEMGYLTAYNRLSPETYSISGNMNLEAVDAWIGKYCGKNPMNSFDQALIEFTHKHAKKRYRVAPLVNPR